MTNGSAWAANSKMGESPEDCILRETWEETGLTLTDYRYRGLVTFVSDEAPTEYMHLFTATGWTGTPHPCDEGELAWIKKSGAAGPSHVGGGQKFSSACWRRTSPSSP